MRRLGLILTVAAATVRAAAPSLPPTGNVMLELQKLEAAGYHGSTDNLRLGFQEQARQAPGDPMPRIFLAWLTLPSDDAWNQLKAVATIHPDNPWVHYGMGRIYATWKMNDLAEKELAQVLARDPKFFPAIIVQGDLARAKEDWAGAEKLYRAALAIADDPFAHSGLGLTLLGAGKKDEARAELKRATKQLPEQPKPLLALIQLSKEAKDPEVLAAAEALAALRPKDREARRQLADLRFERGDKAGAAQEYERLVRLGNLEDAVVERLAGLYRELGDAEGEERTLQTLIALEPTNASPCIRAAELRLAKKDAEGADGQLLEALARDPKRADANLLRAQVKLSQQLPWEALEQFRAAVANDASLEQAQQEATRLEAEFQLPKRRPKGNANNVYWAVSASLEKLFKERRAGSGKLRLRVRIGADGVAQGVDLLEDTVKDPVLTGHVYMSLRDATYDKKKGEPVFDFELGAKKK